MKKNSFKKKLLSYISSIVLIISLVFTIVFVFSARSGEPASIFGYSLSYVPTNSMESVIPQSSYISIKKDKDVSSMKTGDIIVYRAISGEIKGQLIVHRIISVTEEGFITKGDNNPIADTDIVTSDMVYGRYISNVSFLDFLTNFSLNKNVIFIFIILVLFVFIAAQVINISLISIKNKNKTRDDELMKTLKNEMKKKIYDEEMENELKKHYKSNN